MFCKYCGKEIDDKAYVCIHCGKIVGDARDIQQATNGEENSTFGYGVLGFFIPIVGLVLYFVWKNEKPLTAKACGIGAIAGFIGSFVLGIIIGILKALIGA